MPFQDHSDRFDAKDENKQSSSSISKKFLNFKSIDDAKKKQYQHSNHSHRDDVLHKKHKNIFYLFDNGCIHRD